MYMIPKSLNIYQEQEDWLIKNSISFSRYVRKKIKEDMEADNENQKHPSDCNVTSGDES